MTNPWKTSAGRQDWSEQVEEEENEKLKTKEMASSVLEDEEVFPSLTNDATKTKAPKGGKKKGDKKKLSLAEFMKSEGGPAPPAASLSIRDKTDTQIRMSLPTQPGERPAGDLPVNRFHSYRNSRYNNREERGMYNKERGEDLGPSRADESDDWGMNKQPTMSSYGSDRSRGSSGFSSNYDRYGTGNSSSMGNSHRRTNYDDGHYHQQHPSESEHWNRDSHSSNNSKYSYSNRSNFNTFHDNKRYGFGSGYNRSTTSSFYGDRYESTAASSDKWSHRPINQSNTSFNNENNEHHPHGGGGGGGPSHRKVLDLKKRTKPLPEPGTAPDMAEARNKGNNPFGMARPREEVLKERGVTDVLSMSQERFSSRSDVYSDREHGSQPESPASSIRGGGDGGISIQSGTESRELNYHHYNHHLQHNSHRNVNIEVGNEQNLKNKEKSDPFAGARPREEVLGRRRSTDLKEL